MPRPLKQPRSDVVSAAVRNWMLAAGRPTSVRVQRVIVWQFGAGAISITSALIEPDALALYRLIVANGWRFPYLARIFDQSGMRIIRQRMADLLESDGVAADKSRQVAAGIVALALGEAYQRVLLGIVEEGDSEAFARQIEAAVTYGLGRPAARPTF